MILKPTYVDIHIHTSENANKLNQEYDKDTLLKKLKEMAHSCPILISLSDHNVINKKAYLDLSNEDINLLIGAELHVKGDGGIYHCHILFNVDINEENINKINVILDDLYKDKCPKDSDESIPNLQKIINAFNDYEFMLLPHAGQSHKTFNESMKEGHGFDNFIEKTIYLNYFVGFTSRSKERLEKIEEYFQRMGINSFMNLLTCTDNYDPKIYPKPKTKSGARKFIPTWILAKPTFEGLRVALSDSSRLYYDNKPPEKWVSTIGEVTLDSNKVSIDVDLTPGLNVIIGDSSSGKTLFIDSLYKGLTKEFDKSVYKDLGIEKIQIVNPGNEKPHYIHQNFITNILKSDDQKIEEIDIIKDLFPDDEETVKQIRRVLEKLKQAINKMIDSVKYIEECRDRLSHKSTLASLIIDRKIHTNIISLLLPSKTVKEKLNLSKDEYDSFVENLDNIREYFENHPILSDVNENINLILEDLYKARNISSINDKVSSFLIEQNKTEQKESNDYDEQKSTQINEIFEEVTSYLKDLKNFYDAREQLMNMNVSFKTKSLEINGHQLSIESSFKLTKDVLIEAFNKYIKKEYRFEEMEQIVPERLFAKCFSEKPKVENYKDLSNKIYGEINGLDTRKYRIITSDNKEFDKLSPGWKTAIILDLVLGYDKDIAPILIDQPEDNLAVKYINGELIKIIKKNKPKKQIILVTHTATIPVMGDAQNIILCENKNEKINIRSAPLESSINNKRILDHIADITDGGKESLVKRMKKYNFNTFKEQDTKNEINI